MKYIRTKDENNLIIDMTEMKLPYHITENGYIDFNRFGIFKILKQADTIEELCDTFVICVDKQGYLIDDDYKRAMEIMQRNDDDNAICYGAIWCDWGLKYVAKMNTKVELELL